jgi:exodeoxyribonuclease III
MAHMPLRVMSYNILLGGQDRLPCIARTIHGVAPDVVALVEANERAHAEALAGELGMALAFGEANSDFHVAWLSRLPIRAVHNHRRAIFTKTLLEVVVEWEGLEVALFATHLSAGRGESEPRRLQEVAAIVDVLNDNAARPHLLVGDLNAMPPGEVPGQPPPGEVADVRGEALVPLVSAGYLDCYRALHPAASGYTYTTDQPWLRLDYIFASPKLAPRLRACDIVTGADVARCSDHFPIWADFA